MADHNSFGHAAKEARNAANLSLRDAARKLKNLETGEDLSPSYLSKIERGVCDPPSAGLIRQMAALYSVPPEKLLHHAKSRASEFLGAELQERKEILNLYRLAKDMEPDEVLQLIGELVNKLPEKDREAWKAKFKTDFPRENKRNTLFAPRIKPRVLSRLAIRERAEKLLGQFGLTQKTYVPPTPIEQLIEWHNKVDLVPSDGPEMITQNGTPIVLGLTHWDESGLRKIIEINEFLYCSDRLVDKHRLNFTLAHELWHAIEHLDLIPRRFDRRVVGLRRQLAPSMAKTSGSRKLVTDEDWQEWQADTFASEMLIPQWHLSAEFKRRFGQSSLVTPIGMNGLEYATLLVDGLVSSRDHNNTELNKLYAVSRTSMAIRLTSLGLVKEISS